MTSFLLPADEFRGKELIQLGECVTRPLLALSS
jgi:hypothetical protein